MKKITFSHIIIKTIFKNRKYIAEFEAGSGIFNAETTIGGNSIEECIKKTEKFLGVKLNESQYTII